MLAPYQDPFGRQIPSATLLRLEGKELTADLTDEEMGDIFTFDEALAFSELSEREFFTYAKYFNRDSFMCVVQKFVCARERRHFHEDAASRRDDDALHARGNVFPFGGSCTSRTSGSK